MEIKWTASAHRDLVRLYEFLFPVNPRAAKSAVKQLVEEAKLLQSHPFLGVELEEYAPRSVRKPIIGDYELRYEVTELTLYIFIFQLSKEELEFLGSPTVTSKAGARMGLCRSPYVFTKRVWARGSIISSK